LKEVKIKIKELYSYENINSPIYAGEFARMIHKGATK